jgi:ABC-type Na+ efflux pump permease subunit
MSVFAILFMSLTSLILAALLGRHALEWTRPAAVLVGLLLLGVAVWALVEGGATAWISVAVVVGAVSGVWARPRAQRDRTLT